MFKHIWKWIKGLGERGAAYSSTYSLTDGTIAYGSQVRFELSALGSSVNNVINEQIPVGANIADTKLAQITTGQKVNLSALVATSQAQGDIIYASSATELTRLGAGTSGQFLKTLGTGANPLWAFAFSQNKLIATTRDISLTTQWPVTGVGFTPKMVFCIWSDANNAPNGVGFADSAKSGGAILCNSGSGASTYKAGLATFGSNTAFNIMTVTSYDSDGATFDFAKTGSPTNTVGVYFLFIG